jgi:TPR repeat protein
MKRITDLKFVDTYLTEFTGDYRTALEVIDELPDYTLVTLRDLIDHIIDLIAAHHNYSLKAASIFTKIKELQDANKIDSYLADLLHSIRIKGNSGAHKKEVSADTHDQRKDKLRELALSAREELLEVLKTVSSLLHNRRELDLSLAKVSIKKPEVIIAEATLSTDYNAKMKAGRMYESLYHHSVLHGSVIGTDLELVSRMELLEHALACYSMACALSTNMEGYRKLKGHKNSVHEMILEWGKSEPLFRYASVAYQLYDDDNLPQYARERLEASTNAGYAPSQCLLANVLCREGDYELAIEYFIKAAEQENTKALIDLYQLYTDNNFIAPDHDKARKFLDRAIELDCPDAYATKAIDYFEGVTDCKDEKQGHELLNTAIKMGSQIGIEYSLSRSVQRQIAERISSEASTMLKEIRTSLEQQKKKPTTNPHIAKTKIKPNDPCKCGSGKKYKKCCGGIPTIPPSHIFSEWM